MGLAIVFAAELRGQDLGAESFFMSGERRIRVEAAPEFSGVLGVEAPRTAVRTAPGAPADQFVAGVQNYADEAHPELAKFQREGFFFVQTPAEAFDQVRTTVRNIERVRRIGIPVRFPREGVEGEKQALGILTPEFVVRFKQGTTPEQVREVNDARSVVVVRPTLFENQFVLRDKEQNPENTLRLCQEYLASDLVDFAEPNFVFHHVTRNAPVEPTQEPMFAQQWHLRNTGQAGGTAGADANVVGAWKQGYRGDGILVAVMDPDGVETSHADLIANRFINPGESGANAIDGVDNDMNGKVDDFSGWNFLNKTNQTKMDDWAHGTAAAGIAVATANGKGIVGAAPNAKLLAICTGTTTQDDADAFKYAADMGADVISNSWGYEIGIPSTLVVEQAIEEAATLGRGGKGCVILFAMTNEKVDNFGGDDDYFDIASHPNVIAIGRSTNLDKWGESGYGSGMELLAPTGVSCGPPNGTLEITTTDLTGPAGYNAGGATPACFCNGAANEITDADYTSCFNGTSAATPLAAGGAALVLDANEALTAVQVRNVLIRTAVKIEPAVAGYVPDPAGLLFSVTHGYGRIDIDAAVKDALKLKTAAAAATGDGGGANASDDPEENDASTPVIADPTPTSDPTPAAVPAQVVQDEPKLLGYDIEARTIEQAGKEYTVFVVGHLFAVRPASGVDLSQRAELFGDGLHRVKAEWTEGFENRGLLILEGSMGDGELEELAKQGLVDSVGRVVSFKKSRPSLGVLMNRVHIEVSADRNLEDLTRAMPQLAATLEPAEGTDEAIRYIVSPKMPTADPFEVLNALNQAGADSPIKPQTIQPEWVSPIQKR